MRFTSYEKVKNNTNVADQVADAIAASDLLDNRHATGPRASSLIGSCIRQQSYDLLKIPPTDPSNYKSAFYKQVGTLSHSIWQQGLIDSGLCNEEDIEIELQRDELYMNGFVDARTKDGVILEFKTVGTRDLANIKRNKEARTKDVGQILYYMDKLDTKKGIVWYQCRDNLEWQLVSVEKDAPKMVELFNNFQARAQRLYTAWKDEYILEREYSISSAYCKNCLYQTQCWVTDKEIS